MKSWREMRINQELFRFDSSLYLNVNGFGERQVMRKSKPHDHYIMSLTEDWTSKTKPVDWGLLAITNRLREIDSHNNPDSFVNKMDEIHEKRQEAKDRDLKNKTEDFVSDFRKPFAKAFEGINTSTLEKIDSRRKREKNGYRK